MGQIIVRGIPEGDMKALDARARRLGRSREQEVRLLISRVAEEERAWAEHVRKSKEWRQRLEGRDFPALEGMIREDREGR